MLTPLFQKMSLALALALSFSALSGCKKTSFEVPLAGSYSGFLRDGSGLTWVRAESAPRNPEDLKEGWKFTLRTDPASDLPLALELTPASRTALRLRLGNLIPEETLLERTGPRGSIQSLCFAHQGEIRIPEPRESIRICVLKDAIELEAEGTSSPLTLSLVHESRTQTDRWETPRSFTLDQYILEAREQNFDQRLQAERVFQSRWKARQAYLNLLPSLNLWSGVRLATSTEFTSLISLASSLTPFLFPSRWVDAVAAQHLTRADEYAFQALRLDTSLIAETAGLSYLRNRETLQKLDEQIESITPLVSDIQARERIGLHPPGSSEEITLLSAELRTTAQTLRNSLPGERLMLAETLGLSNPEGVLELDEATSLNRPYPTREELEAARKLALGQALEVRQLDELIRATALNRVSTYLGWLDPASDASTNLGAGLPVTLILNQSKLAELRLLQERTRSQIAQKVQQAYLGVEQEEALILSLIELSDQYAARMDRLSGLLRMGIPVTEGELIRAIQGQIKSELDLIRSRYQLRGALALWSRNLQGLEAATDDGSR